eukprot:scaffold332_cov105-Isochrysis_galbana.AAC.14
MLHMTQGVLCALCLRRATRSVRGVFGDCGGADRAGGVRLGISGSAELAREQQPWRQGQGREWQHRLCDIGPFTAGDPCSHRQEPGSASKKKTCKTLKCPACPVH